MIKQLTTKEKEELDFLETTGKKDSSKVMRHNYLSLKAASLNFRFGEKSYPSAFYDFLISKGIDINRSILISAANWTQGENPLFGEVLSQDELFFEFDLDFSKSGKELIKCNEWNDITSTKNLGTSNKGVSKSYERIAIEVLRELNS